MIDFWEALGRLATYKDLNSAFLEHLPPVGPIPQLANAKLKCVGLDMPQSQYEAVQNFFAPILTESYLSLMGAGELLWTYSFEESRAAMLDLLKITPRAASGLHGPSTSYFITLGMLIVDKDFRHSLQTSEEKAVKLIRRLSDPENCQIATLANNPAVESGATGVAKLPWDGGCSARMVYWPGHLHPIGIDADAAWESGNAIPPGSTGQQVRSSAA